MNIYNEVVMSVHTSTYGTYGTYGTMVPYSLDLFYPGIQVTRIVKLR